MHVDLSQVKIREMTPQDIADVQVVTELHLHVHGNDLIPQELYTKSGFETVSVKPNCYSDGGAAHHMRYCTPAQTAVA